MINQKQELADDRMLALLLHQIKHKHHKNNKFQCEADSQNNKQNSGQNHSAYPKGKKDGKEKEDYRSIERILGLVAESVSCMIEQIIEEFQHRIMIIGQKMDRLDEEVELIRQLMRRKSCERQKEGKQEKQDKEEGYLISQLYSLSKQIEELRGRLSSKADHNLDQCPENQSSIKLTPIKIPEYDDPYEHFPCYSPISTFSPTPRSTPQKVRLNQLILKQYAKQAQIKDLKIQKYQHFLRNTYGFMEQIKQSLSNFLPCDACQLQKVLNKFIDDRSLTKNQQNDEISIDSKVNASLGRDGDDEDEPSLLDDDLMEEY